MEKIRICHVVNIISGKSDGVYAHLKMLFKYVDPDTFEQYLVFQGDPAIEEEVKSLGVTVYPLPLLKKKFSVAVFVELYRFLKENEISIIHSHLIKPYIIVGVINVILGKKAIFNYHGSFIHLPVYYNKFEEAVYRAAHTLIYFFRSYHRVVVPSEASKKILLSESALFPQIEVYYNGAVTTGESFSNIADVGLDNPLWQNTHKIGIVGRLEPQKRIDIALEIAQKLLQRRDDVRFIFVGNGSLEREVKDLVESLRLKERVSVLGYVHNVKTCLRAFDLVLLTSDWEGVPLVMWEAMAEGVPVVSSDVGGVREILERENCGRVYERRNIDAAVSVLEELLNGKELRELMGKNGITAIEKKYNEREFGKRFQSIYVDLLRQV